MGFPLGTLQLRRTVGFGRCPLRRTVAFRLRIAYDYRPLPWLHVRRPFSLAMRPTASGDTKRLSV
jgi:hypothetical protein